MIIYFATTMSDKSQGESLTEQRCPHRLLSYYYLEKQEIMEKDLEEYHRTGKSDLSETKKLKRYKFKLTGGSHERLAISKILEDIVNAIEG